MNPLCLINHKWTSAAEEGIEPTQEQIKKGLDGFLDYAAIYCKRCGERHKLNSAPVQQKFQETKMSEPENVAGMLKNEFHKMSFFFQNVSRIDYFSMRCQGDHPVTGKTCVVYLKHNANKSVFEVKSILNDFFYGRENYLVKDFTERAKRKLNNSAYASGISVHGKDYDGDTLQMDFKFHDQSQMMFIAENGLFKLEDNRPGNFLMLEEKC